MANIGKRLRKRGISKSSKHSESFRKLVALAVIKENLTLKEASERFNVIHQTISRWVLHYYDEIEQTNVIGTMTHPPDATTPAPLPELTEYETKLRQAQLKITALETMIELAEQTYKIAIRKNSGTKQPE